MMDVLRVLLFIVSLYVVGILVFRLIMRDLSHSSIFETLAVSFGLGIGLLTTGAFVLNYFRFPIALSTVFLLILFLICVPVIFTKKNYLSSLRKIRIKGLFSIINDLSFFDKILVLLILLFIGFVFLSSISQPLNTFDSRAHWGLTAKILYHNKTVYSDGLFDVDRVHPHKDYPLLIPYSESLVYTFMGKVDDQWVRIIFPFFYLSLLLYIYSIQRRFFSRSHSLVFTAVLAGLPSLTIVSGGGVLSGYADVPLSFFAAVSFLYCYTWLHSYEKKYIVLASLFFIFTIFTKNEGSVLFIIMVFSMFLVLLSLRHPTVQQKSIAMAMLFFIPLVGNLPWFIMRTHLPVYSEYNYTGLLNFRSVAEGISRLPMILIYFFKEFFLSIHRWSFFGLLITFSGIIAIKKLFRNHNLVLIMPLLSYCAVLVLIYMITPFQLNDVISGALTRLLTHIAPIGVFLLSKLFYDQKFIEFKIGRTSFRGL